MRLTECNKCCLCKSRQHISFSKGEKPASVLIVFGKEPRTEDDEKRLAEFIRMLNYELKRDWYYSFALKCFSKDTKISYKQLKKCSTWLKKEIDQVEPYIIIMVGKLATLAVLNKEIEKYIVPNIFYNSNNGKTKFYFRCEPIIGQLKKIEFGLNKVVKFLKEYYQYG